MSQTEQQKEDTFEVKKITQHTHVKLMTNSKSNDISQQLAYFSKVVSLLFIHYYFSSATEIFGFNLN